jgi:environmental stress-induced protein Ves
MSVQVFKDHAAMPWPNGAGITYEVTRFPESGDFEWRISLADIDNDCPFSVMPGVDRGIVLMEGDHMILANPEQKLRIDQLVAFNYPGEIGYDCSLPAGPAKDLNIMTRRGKFASKTVVLGGGTHQIDASKDVHIIVGLRGVTSVEGQLLNYRDAAKLSGATEVTTDGTFAHIVLTAV